MTSPGDTDPPPAPEPGPQAPAAAENWTPPVIDPGPERVQDPMTIVTMPMGAFEPGFSAPAPTPGYGTATALAEPPEPRRDITHDELIELYAAHHDGLVRFAALVAPEDGMAEDLVQEAFVSLYKSWRRIREPEKVPAYLRATVANLARGRGRRMSTAKRNQPAPAPDVASAEDGALASENHAEVIAMLRRLPARQRECLVLRYYQGQNESEIAATLGISVGSVRTHTSRGMAALGKHLGVSA